MFFYFSLTLSSLNHLSLSKTTREYANFHKDQPYERAVYEVQVCNETPRWTNEEYLGASASSSCPFPLSLMFPFCFFFIRGCVFLFFSFSSYSDNVSLVFLIEVCPTVTLEELNAFVPKLFESMYIVALCIGNSTVEEAKVISFLLSHLLFSISFPFSCLDDNLSPR